MGKRRSSRRPASGEEVPEAISGREGFTCKTCGKIFNQLGKLTLHERTHTGEVPYSCTHCEKSFSQKAALKVHIRTHTGERPFGCNLCEKRFTRADHLQQHIRTHTGERPHACTECDKTFATWAAVSRHRAEHFSQGKFKCSMCDKAFTRADNFRSHLARKHRVNQEIKIKNENPDIAGNELLDAMTADDYESVLGPHFLMNE